MRREDHDQIIEELFLLQRVAQRINSNLDLDALLEEIVTDVSVTFGCSRLAVLLKDDQANELVVGADCGGDAQHYIKGERFKIGEYGIMGHVGATGETYYAPDVSTDPYYRMGDEETRSEVGIPLRSHGQLIGVFNAEHKEIDGFSPARIQVLEGLAGHIATAIENARMFQRERVEKERMKKELHDARRIQTALFPDRVPAMSGFVVEGQCLPCLEVGGDWYDYIPLPDGRLAIALADVSGKGMGAALLMSSTRTVLRLIAEGGYPPGETLSRVNSILLKDFPTARFVTMVYGILDPQRGTIVFANAGHLHPLFVDSDGARFLPTDAGLPLGIIDGSFAECTVKMTPGSRLVFYSDGVTEALDPSGLQYGEMHLRDHFLSPAVTITSLLTDLSAFAGGQPVSDDVTVVMMACPA